MALLKMFNSQLLLWSQDSKYPRQVTDALREMLQETEEEFDHAQTMENGPKASRSVTTGEVKKAEVAELGLARGSEMAILQCQPNHEIIFILREHEEWYKAMPPGQL